MLLIHSNSLTQHLESQYEYQIVGTVDLDWLVEQPRNTLFNMFKQWYKPAFNHRERIVLYSRSEVSFDLLVHIQSCGSLVDISNFFILICSPTSNADQFEKIKQLYPAIDSTFSNLEIGFLDAYNTTHHNPLINLPLTFCFNPWAHLEISSQGEFKPCCVYKESIKDSDNRPYNINTHSIEEVYHSDYLKRLRQQFIDGKKPSECSHCWFKEQHGGKSNRHWSEDHLGLAAQCLHIEKESTENVISLDIKLGNLCNFKCRVCSPQSSSRIADEHARYFNTLLDLKKVNSGSQWSENTQIWKNFNVLSKQLINIDFYGGEPFLVKQHEVFLDYLIEHNCASAIRLHYNSNGSVYPAHLFDKWKLFRQVDISFSIDNIGSKFELERGGSWTQVESNLDKFLDSKLSNMILSVFTTVNIQNVYYLEELINWFETKTFNSLHFNLLEQPRFLSITTMNAELTTLVLNKLNQLDQKILIKYNVLPIINLIRQTKPLQDQVDQLREYMLKLDNIRNQDFGQTHTELANIIYKGK
jgi:MoaA/NifB/PqqE/SkfB family radical SAM enzyme